MLIAGDLTIKKLQSSINFNNWSIIAELLKLFSFDPQLTAEIQMAAYPGISMSARTYLDEEMFGNMKDVAGGCRHSGLCWTREQGLYNEVIYGLLKKTYLEVAMSEIINASDPRK